MNIKYNKAEEKYLNTQLTLRVICKEFKIDRNLFSKYLKSKSIDTSRKLKVDKNTFEIIDTEEKAYWLGFLYADGNVYYNKNNKQYVIELGLAIKDYNHLLKFKQFLRSDYKIEHRVKTNSCRIRIHSKKMCDDLINLGCIPNKSLILKFPEFLDTKLISPFIRGYFDGDGCISSYIKTTPDISLLGTKEFLLYINNIYQKEKSLFKDLRHKNNTFSIRFKINNGLTFLYDIYNNANIYLDRKYNIYNYLLNCRSRKKFFELLESKYGEGCDS